MAWTSFHRPATIAPLRRNPGAASSAERHGPPGPRRRHRHGGGRRACDLERTGQGRARQTAYVSGLECRSGRDRGRGARVLAAARPFGLADSSHLRADADSLHGALVRCLPHRRSEPGLSDHPRPLAHVRGAGCARLRGRGAVAPAVCGHCHRVRGHGVAGLRPSPGGQDARLAPFGLLPPTR
jgi:hypothetical protein